MLDQYVFGTHNRNSPEAEIPILDYEEENFKLGGAANVAVNLQDLKRTPILISVIGKDFGAKKLKQACREAKIKSVFVTTKKRTTTIKTRFVDKQFKQFLRVDNEIKTYISKEMELQLSEKISKLIDQNEIEAIIIQDYNKGVVTKSLIAFLKKVSKNNQIPLFVDPKYSNFKSLSNCTLFKPNLKELEDFVGKKIKINAKYILKCLSLSGLDDNKICVVTLGAHGIFYHSDGNLGIIGGETVENPDVSGAGDTVIAVLCHLYLKKTNLGTMVEIANKSGAYVCKKPGIASISLKNLKTLF